MQPLYGWPSHRTNCPLPLLFPLLSCSAYCHGLERTASTGINFHGRPLCGWPSRVPTTPLLLLLLFLLPCCSATYTHTRLAPSGCVVVSSPGRRLRGVVLHISAPRGHGAAGVFVEQRPLDRVRPAGGRTQIPVSFFFFNGICSPRTDLFPLDDLVFFRCCACF